MSGHSQSWKRRAALYVCRVGGTYSRGLACGGTGMWQRMQVGSRASSQVTWKGRVSFGRSMMIDLGSGHDCDHEARATSVVPCRRCENSPGTRPFSPLEVLPPTWWLWRVWLRCLRNERLGSGYDPQTVVEECAQDLAAGMTRRERKSWKTLPRRTAADCQSHCRQAEMQQGERERLRLDVPSNARGRLGVPLRTAAKCSAIYEQARLTIAPP